MVFGLFKKRLDPRMIDLAAGSARNRFRESLEDGCSIYCKALTEVDGCIRRSPDAQLMVLSVLRPAIDFALQDAYLKSGKIMSFEPLPTALTNDEERKAIRVAIGDLPTSKANLDMRFRYMFANNLSSPTEDALWAETVTISQPVVRRAFEQKKAINSFWVGVIARLSEGDADGAKRQLMEAR